MTIVNNVLRSIRRLQSSNTDKLNIVTICKNNEKYIALLAKTLHNFHMPSNNVWNSAIEKRPSNVYSVSSTTHFEPFDYIMCYDRAEQYEEALQISRNLHIPIILVDMCSRPLIRPAHILEIMNPIDLNVLDRNVALQVYSNHHIEMSWRNSDKLSTTIPIGIDVDKFQNQQLDQTLISIDNNTVPQVGAQIGRQIQNSYTVLPTDHENLEDITLNKTRYFINTYKSITIKTLEAMSAGNVVISLRNTDTESFIQHQETGILIDNIEQLNETIESLEKSNTIRIKIAQQARQKIILEHSIENFLNKWSVAFNLAQSTFFNSPA